MLREQNTTRLLASKIIFLGIPTGRRLVDCRKNAQSRRRVNNHCTTHKFLCILEQMNWTSVTLNLTGILTH